MIDTERIERLEKMVEKLYHESELLSLYIPKLCEIMEKYFKTSYKYREEKEAQLRGVRDFLLFLNNGLNNHTSLPHPYKKDKRYISTIIDTEQPQSNPQHCNRLVSNVATQKKEATDAT